LRHSVYRFSLKLFTPFQFKASTRRINRRFSGREGLSAGSNLVCVRV